MYWILKHTGALVFFNSLNNNSPSQIHKNKVNERNIKRPERQSYGRLSMNSDDGFLQANTNKSSSLFDEDDDDNDNNNNNNFEKHKIKDDHGNYIEKNENDLKLKSDDKNNNNLNETLKNKLQSFSVSDDEDYDETLTCNVCDRGFQCHRKLASHQQKKRHFGCNGCDSLFSSLMLLEHHKEEFEHWSDDEFDDRKPCCRNNRLDDYFDTDSLSSDAESEDMERLL